MSALLAKTVRLACDQSSADSAIDQVTGKRLVFWRGAAALVQCAFFTGVPATGTILTDVTNIVSVELIVRKHNPVGAILLDKTLRQSDMANCTYAAWLAGTGQHCSFSLAEAYTSWDVLASGSLPIYFSIFVTTATSSYIAGQGYGQIVDVGITDINAPYLPSGLVDLAPASTTSYSLQPVRGGAAVRIIATNPGTVYTYTLLLSETDVLPGWLVDCYIEVPTTINVTVEVRSGALTGTLLHSVVGDMDNVTEQNVIFRFDGNHWFKFGPAIG